MITIYWEKQEAALCAVHSINNLLQGPYYTAVDFANIASELDKEERMLLGQSNMNIDEAKETANVNLGGNFSIQVIKKALQIWNLSINRMNTTIPNHNISCYAYICHLHEHWFCIRQLYGEWFNLDSVANGPTLISEFYLSAYLAQLQTEGYSVFKITGDFPPINKDLEGSGQWIPRSMINFETSSSSKKPSAIQQNDDDDLLQQALLLSMTSSQNEEDDELQRALQLSMKPMENSQNESIVTSNSENNNQLEVEITDKGHNNIKDDTNNNIVVKEIIHNRQQEEEAESTCADDKQSQINRSYIIDNELPSIFCQITLTNGKKVKLDQPFKSTQTIGDICNAIPNEYENNDNFYLATIHPHRSFKDKNQVLKDLNLGKRINFMVKYDKISEKE